jgi:hypothetical protein
MHMPVCVLYYTKYIDVGKQKVAAPYGAATFCFILHTLPKAKS